MSRKKRLSPDELLELANKEEKKSNRGKLKIYLGSSPGVGKTYAMLEDSLSLIDQGKDIIIGVVESHGRTEIDKFIGKFEILPRKNIQYHSQTLQEFDIDAALKRNPSIILIDEMAHTNVPGLRHNKRWQDIREILDRGIDVFTTLNVQHIESLNDIVSQIVHTRISETVPDSMIEMADSVELIDIPPAELIKRLKDGKVYIPKQAELAEENFFREGNLTALREIALRATAERVRAEVLTYRQARGIKQIWPTKDKLMVCIAPGGNSTKLIRSTRRLATTLEVHWMAVHVDYGLTDTKRNSAIQNLRLAEQLGAQTKIISSTNIVDGILNCARDNNITKIIIGKRTRSRLRNLFFLDLTDKLIINSDEIDIYIITHEEKNKKASTVKEDISKEFFKLHEYGFAIGLISFAIIISIALSPFFFVGNLGLIILLAVTIVAAFTSTGPTILASILSVITFDYFFRDPYHTFTPRLEHIFSITAILFIGLTVNQLTRIMRRQIAASHRAEQRTSTLHALSKQLATARGFDNLFSIATEFMENTFESDIVFLLAKQGSLQPKATNNEKIYLTDKDKSVAQWAYDLNQVAGLGTNTLPFSDSVYIPLTTSQKPIGVLKVKPHTKNYQFTPEHIHLLEVCANQIALALQADKLQEKSKKFEIETETDRIRAALLESVSHDLRTPLIAALGSANTLNEMASSLSKVEIKNISLEIKTELEQLSRLIHNFLQISYLEDKSIKFKKSYVPVRDLIDSAIKLSHSKLGKKLINVDMPDNLPKIPVDKTLIEEVFVNLIDNAMKFTPIDSPIEIEAKLDSDMIVIGIKDLGQGISPKELNKLFEKFYRGRKLTTERGLGLGLSICRSIVNAHGGKIWAENRAEGGAAFYFTLPLTE